MVVWLASQVVLYMRSPTAFDPSFQYYTTLAGIEGKNTLIRFPSLPTKFTTPPRFKCAASEGLTMIVCFDNACAGLQGAVRRGG